MVLHLLVRIPPMQARIEISHADRPGSAGVSICYITRRTSMG